MGILVVCGCMLCDWCVQVVINTLVRRALFVRLYRAARDAQLQQRRDDAAAASSSPDASLAASSTASSAAFRPSLAAFDMRFFDGVAAIDVGDTGAMLCMVPTLVELVCTCFFALFGGLPP